MKNIILVALLLPISAYSASMCIPSNTYFTILAPEHDGISVVDSGSTWRVNFDYTTAGFGTETISFIKGISSCNEIVGTPNSADGNISASTSDVGQNCWCDMTAPLVSAWVFAQSYSSNAECANLCNALCANKIKTDSVFRTAVYNNVW